MGMKIQNANYRLLGLIVVLAASTTGCFNLPSQSRTIASSAAINDDQIYDLVPISFSAGPASSTAQVINFRGVAKTFEGLTGVKTTEFITGDPSIVNDISTYSISSQADSLTAPMLLNQTRLAAGLCLAMVKHEREMTSGRKFFGMFNFRASSNDTPLATQNLKAAILDSSAKIYKTFCGKSASDKLVSDATKGVDEMVRDEIIAGLGVDADVKDNRPGFNRTVSGGTDNNYYLNAVDSAVMTCTAFLASACTLTNN
jgi:hypothetical protein